MRQHSYLTRINDAIWEDLNRVKQLDGQSINSLINQGCRSIVEEKKQDLVQQRKTRNTLSAATGL